MFEVRRAHSTNLAAFKALLYSNNRLARADTIARVRCSGGIYGVDYRIVHPGGQIRRLRSRGRVQVDEEGQPVRHRGVVFDIDAYKRAEEEQKTVEAQVRTREARLYAIPDTMTEGMIVIDERGIIFVQPCCRAHLRLPVGRDRGSEDQSGAAGAGSRPILCGLSSW